MRSLLTGVGGGSNDSSKRTIPCKIPDEMRTAVLACFVVAVCLSICSADASKSAPSRIWFGEDQTPKNQITFFRKVFNVNDADLIAKENVLRYSANSNAAIFLNGKTLRRRVTRFFDGAETCEVIRLTPNTLRLGPNTIVVRHHNWGDAVTFQRTGQKQASLWVSSDFVWTDASWEANIAKEYHAHPNQIEGANPPGVTRIRFPIIMSGQTERETTELHFSPRALGWGTVSVLPERPDPTDVETAGTGGDFVSPTHVVASGELKLGAPLDLYNPYDAANISLVSEYHPKIIGGKFTTPLSVDVGANSAPQYFTVGFDRPVHGYVSMTLDHCTEGTVIDVSYLETSRLTFTGESLLDETTGWMNTKAVVGTGYGDRYICVGGKQAFEFPDERTARWAIIVFHFPAATSANALVSSFGIFEDQQLLTQIGSFESGDEIMDQIVKLSLIHAKVTMSDTLVDCPSREDGQWIEDARIRANLASRWFGDSGLREILIRSQMSSQYPDENTHPFAPSNFPAESSYDWSFAWPGAVYDHWAWTNDSTIVSAQLGAIDKYWQVLLNEQDPSTSLWLSSNILADLFVGVHCAGPCASGIVYPMIVQRLEQSAEMAGALGDEISMKKWNQFASSLRKSFSKYFIGNSPVAVFDTVTLDENGFISQKGISQAGQTMAVYTGLLTPSQALDAVNFAFPEPDGIPPNRVPRWNNPTFLYRALTALSDTVGDLRAIRHMKERFSQYLPGNPANPISVGLQGPYGGPLPEYWVSREDMNLKVGDISHTQPVDASGSHGWASVGLLWLHEKILGVTQEPMHYGGKVTVRPSVAGLPYIKGTTVVRGAVIQIICDVSAGKYSLSATHDPVAPFPEIEILSPRDCGPSGTFSFEGRPPVDSFVISAPSSYDFTLSHCPI